MPHLLQLLQSALLLRTHMDLLFSALLCDPGDFRDTRRGEGDKAVTEAEEKAVM